MFSTKRDQDMVDQYTAEEFDELLEVLLLCNSKREYERVLARLSNSFARHQPDARGRFDGDPLNRVLWGRAIGRTEYKPSGMERSRRTGPLTWVEKKVVDWAKHSVSNERREVDPTHTYVALLLNRTIEEIKDYLGCGVAKLGLFS